MRAAAWAGGGVFVLSLAYAAGCYLGRFGQPPPPGPRARPVLADVLLFTGFALHHSLFARPGLKRLVRHIVHPAFERSLYTWIASLLFLAVCRLWQPVPGTLYHLHGGWRALGYAAQLGGVLLTVAGARALDVLDLAGIRPLLPAAGAAPVAHVPLRTTGAFGLVRHPLYLGWALLTCAAPDLTPTRAVFALVSTAYVAMAIPWEERGLMETFGGRYAEYRRRVRWRMIPFIY